MTHITSNATLHHEDFVYYALLWKQPKDRLAYLETCDDTGRLLELMSDVSYPKLYNSSIARYATFLFDESEPRGLFHTRDEAWNSVRNEPTARVVDVPLVELDRPQYDEYYSECLATEKDSEEA
jgi:hypothetical protein